MPDLDKILLFRMTHIDNIPHILQYGITHRDSTNTNREYKAIGDSTIISSRNDFHLGNNRLLGDYIPFYFATRTPMLYVIQRGYNLVNKTPVDQIIYCISSVQTMINHSVEFLFSDGQANSRLSNFYDINDVSRIDSLLDFNAINSRYWNDDNDKDLKRRKEAEFLISTEIGISAINGYAVYNQSSKERLMTYGIEESKISIHSNYYFNPS